MDEILLCDLVVYACRISVALVCVQVRCVFQFYCRFQHFHEFSSIYAKLCAWQTINTNWCLLSLPLDTPLLVEHNGVVHWGRG